MSKNIILLSDGTGNSTIKDRGTNVFNLYEALDLNNSATTQIAFYDDGVGTQQLKPLKLLGGAFGWGLARNVCSLYKQLLQTYEAGDNIYLFGFSRGAFTARTLASLIANKGVLDIAYYPTDEQLDMAVFHLYEQYRAQYPALLERALYKPFVNLLYPHQPALHFKSYLSSDNRQKVKIATGAEIDLTIKFIGVWDTVDAVGLPFDGATRFWNNTIFRFKFPDHQLAPCVEQACHALSIDDERQSFHPLLWQQDERIEQVWFPGVHANVGGGYPRHGLAWVALTWMMNKAEQAGLVFIPKDKSFISEHQYALDKLYDSRAGFGVYYRYKPRNIARISTHYQISEPQIHESVFQRIASGVFAYAPGNFPAYFQVVSNSGIHCHSNAIQTTVNLTAQIPAANSLDENPETATIPQQEILENQAPLLRKAAFLIRFRRTIYYLFFAYSAVIFYWITKNDFIYGGLGFTLKKLFAPDELLGKLAMTFVELPFLAPAGLVIFACAVFIRSQIAKVFADFWSPLRHQLKKLL